ncbi:MAG: patatin-like phospholipase family protein [Dehalococcoidia bacterium]|nr:patatin-like phospholipase family protein [Dehalococcoidia bacterium]
MNRRYPESRTQDAHRNRRAPVCWENDLPFRILSIDGGGIRGIFPAAILAFLEREYLGGQSVGEYFDLIAGTSTGGILALGLGAGLSADDMLDMYLDEGYRVFPSRKKGLRGQVRRWVSAQYDRRPLDELLEQQLGDRTLRDSKRRLLIPSTEGRNGEVWVFKTPHHPGYTIDGDMRMSSVAAATSAAPTYFTPFAEHGYTFLDGGVWANNPVMTALVEALSCFTIGTENVRILSIGCGQKQFRINRVQAEYSGKIHWRNIIDVAMQFQSVTAINQAGLLVGRDHIIRLDRADGSDPIGLDDWEMAKTLLPAEGMEVACHGAERIVQMFLASPSPPFTPLA